MYWFSIVFAVLLSILVLTLKFAVLPKVADYREKIVAYVAEASGMSVSADGIRSGWSGFRPYVELENVQFLEPAGSRSDLRPPGTVAFKLPKLHASLSWWALLIGQVRFDEIHLVSPELALTRSKDGLIYFAGRALNASQATNEDGRLLNWLVEQTALQIDHAALSWKDDLSPGQELHFSEVGIRLEKSGERHLLGITATPPRNLARNMEARGDLLLEQVAGRWEFAGKLYASVTDANLDELRLHIPVPQQLQSGAGNVRAWAELDNRKGPGVNGVNPVRSISADVHLTNAHAQWDADVAPIHLARLSGRLEYRQEEGGFTVGSKRLELRTREGVTLPPADFSVTLQNQSDVTRAQGEIAGNDIDLKVVTALLEYFPVGKDVRSLAARYALHGVIRNAQFAWGGYLDKPSRYRVRGMLENFGVRAGETSPGLEGFSGSVEGDQAGGKFSAGAKNMTITLAAYMRSPLQFDQFSGEGKWRAGGEALEIDFDKMAFENAGLSGELSGRYWRYRADGPRAKDEKGPGSLDIKGKFAHIDAKVVADYLPNRIAVTRRYLDRAVKGGRLDDVEFSLRGELYEFPFHNGKGGDWKIQAKLNKVKFDYLDKWPVAEDLNGKVSVANSTFTATVEDGRIFNAKLGRTTLSVPDLLAQPSVLSIDGTTNARAEDVMRYLRESPLVDGVGSFSKFVAIEGPGKLDLSLKIPLVGNEIFRINGNYLLKSGTARPSFGPAISSLSGSVAFTEANVKSSGLAGMAYGNPLNISIGGGGGVPIAVDFLGRANLADMGDVLPFALPQQIQGTTDFRGRIGPRNGGIEVAIDTDLTGVSSTLPFPLAKLTDEARALAVRFSHTGLADEKIHLTLVAGAAAAASADGDSRIDARFRRRFDANGVAHGLYGGLASANDAVPEELVLAEGLWLGGSLKALDYDAWNSAFQNFYSPAAAGKSAGGESPLTGFDFKLGSLQAYGRTFSSMKLKGRHASDVWAMSVESADAAGDFTWRAGAGNDPGLVRARLKKLVIGDEAPGKAAETPVDTAREVHLPALDIVADDFTFKERWLGKLEMRAAQQDVNWKIDQLNVSNGHAQLEMNGIWLRDGDPGSPSKPGASGSRTNMNIKFEANNLNPLFNQFGYADAIKGGTGKLEGKLSWPGHAYQFRLENLSGEFKVEARKGQFSNAPVGAAKLLGLLSLQSIARRLTFNFNDIVGKGFAFDTIDASVRVANGIMYTDDLVIAGPSAEVKFAGQVSLPEETQNMSMTFKPQIDSGIALGVGFTTLGPAGALGAWIVQKIAGSPFEKILSVQYTVTGKWDDAVLTEVKADKMSVTIPATAPAPAAPPAVNPDAPKKSP
ncbi:MAG: TIGR02099 family protein [Betaproteobacteria bacterium]|nr:TIGR02099 family protein [Betaproteobacteria bacterium]